MLNTKRFLSEFVPVTILILSVLIFFSKIIFSGSPLFGSDFTFQFYPWKKFIYDYVWSHGALPFWNPYTFSGTPFIANIQASMFYPLGFLFYILPTEYAYGYTIILHCILGSIFMYAFIRSLSVHKAGALLAAIIFTYNGFFMAHLYAGHLTFVQNYVWIPLIFLYLHKFLNTSYFRYAAITGLFLGIQILGGFPQIAFYTILGILAFGLFHIGISLRTRHIKDLIRIGLGLATVVSIGFALAAIQIFPTLEFMNLSTRAGGVSYDFATYDSLHPKELLSFLIPEIFGSVVNQTYWRSSEIWHFWETCGYVGILPLCLAFVLAKRPSLRYFHLFFTALVLLSLFLALGKYNPIYPIIYKLPGFNSFRIPAQIVYLYVFGLAVLAGIGLNRILENEWLFGTAFVIFFTLTSIILISFSVGLHAFPYHFFFHLFKTFSESPAQQINTVRLYDNIGFALDRAVLLFFTSASLLLMMKNNRLSPRVFNILALVIVMMDLGLFGMQFIKTYNFVTPAAKQSLIAQLSQNPVRGRVVTISKSFKTNDGLEYRFPSILGYDPLILRRYARYIQASQNCPPQDHIVNLAWIKDPGAKLLRMLNVRQVVREQGVTIVDSVFPYATLVNKTIIKPEGEVLGFMKGEDFDPREMVVLDCAAHTPHITYDGPGSDFKASCSVLQYNDKSIRITTSANQQAYLVLSEIFYPGWVATVDGKKAPLLRGNYLFRVVPLERGNHEVCLRFVSWPFRIGSIVSMVALVCSLWFIKRKRGENNEKN
ncbi:MAG: hypothetical protein DRH17_01820 [Deltaproteobacteria bacterium]|nr:MAG: hypothetical protein DRH17_01820 [Deltaproteobacteria bacterium]